MSNLSSVQKASIALLKINMDLANGIYSKEDLEPELSLFFARVEETAKGAASCREEEKEKK